jgi:hypothetical protein
MALDIDIAISKPITVGCVDRAFSDPPRGGTGFSINRKGAFSEMIYHTLREYQNLATGVVVLLSVEVDIWLSPRAKSGQRAEAGRQQQRCFAWRRFEPFALRQVEVKDHGRIKNRTRTRTNTNPNDTEANAAGRSVRACVARKSKS